LEAHRVVDLLPDRSSSTLTSWLRRHPDVEIVTRDRSTEYTRAVAKGALHARQVVDRWHLLLNGRQVVERWLAGAHVRLRALPPVWGPTRTSSAVTPVSRALSEERAHEDSRERRLAVY
jgi:hypothetical protein